MPISSNTRLLFIVSYIGGKLAGLDSNDTISWSDDLIHAFRQAQQALKSTKTIHIPHPQDTLWIVTDGALRKPGIGATFRVEMISFFSQDSLVPNCLSARYHVFLVRLRLCRAGQLSNITSLT